MLDNCVTIFTKNVDENSQKKCPRKFTQKRSSVGYFVHENSSKVSTRIHYPFCPQKFSFYIHEKSSTQNLWSIYWDLFKKSWFLNWLHVLLALQYMIWLIWKLKRYCDFTTSEMISTHFSIVVKIEPAASFSTCIVSHFVLYWHFMLNAYYKLVSQNIL